MRAKDAVGRYGEDVAARHLAETGLIILQRNWRCAEGEIDIVARDGPVLVVCEVKTRSSLAFGGPAEAVGYRKRAKLRRLAILWIEGHREHGDPAFWPELRFDVVSVLRADRGAATIDHIRAAF
jgi:putative endonuclease